MNREEKRQAINAMRMERAVINREAVERDMPPGDGPIELTHELIEKCRTPSGGFTNASLIPLGEGAPLVSGWAKRLIGKRVSRAEYRQALEGRYIIGIKSVRKDC